MTSFKKVSVIWISLKVLPISMDAKTSFSFSVIALFSLGAPFTSLCFRPLDTLASFLISMYLRKTYPKTQTTPQKKPLASYSLKHFGLPACIFTLGLWEFSFFFSLASLSFFEELLPITSYIGSYLCWFSICLLCITHTYSVYYLQTLYSSICPLASSFITASLFLCNSYFSNQAVF